MAAVLPNDTCMSASVLNVPETDTAARFVPPIPQTVEQTGLTESFLQQLILKILYYRAEAVGRDLAKHLGLNSASSRARSSISSCSTWWW